MAVNNLIENDSDEQNAANSKPAGAYDGAPLTPAETASLDQIEAGLKDSNSQQTNQASKSSSSDPGPVTEPTQNSTANNKPSRFSQVKGFAKKRKKWLIIGGGGLGLLIGSSLVGILLLLPLKAANLLNVITKKQFGRMEDALEKRSQKLVMKYLIGKASIDGSGGETIVTGKLLNDLYDNWSVNKFETKLKEKHGIEVTKNVQNNTYNVRQYGRPIASDLTGNALESIGNNEFRGILDTAVKDQTRWNQVYKRRHLRGSLYKKWGVRKWYLFPKTREKVASKNLAIKRSIQKTLIERTVDPISKNYGNYFRCLIGEGSCTEFKQTTPDAPDDSSSTEPKSQADLDREAGQASTRNAAESADEAGSKIAQEAAEAAAREAGEDASQKLLIQQLVDTVQKIVSNQIVKSVAAGIGVLAMISTIDKAIDEGGAIEQIIKAKNSLQYASYFSVMASSIDQLLADDLNSSEANELIGQIGDYEKSRIYRKDYVGTANSAAATAAVGASSPIYDDFTTCADNNNQPLPPGELICDNKKIKWEGAEKLRENFAFKVLHEIAVAYRATIGGVVDAFRSLTDMVGLDSLINGIGNTIVNVVDGVVPIKDWLSSGFSAAMNYFFGPVITGAETDGDVFNGMEIGANVTANEFVQQSGGTYITSEQAAEIDRDIAIENEQKNSKNAYWSRVASLDNPRSLLSRFIAWIPARTSDLPIKSTKALVSALNPVNQLNNIAFLSSVFLPNSIAYAESTSFSNPAGVDQFAFDTNALLSAPLTDPDSPQCQQEIAAHNSALEQWKEDSNVKIPTTLCILDKIAIQANKAMFNNEDDGGLKAEISSSTSQQATGGAVPTSAARAEINARLTNYMNSGQLYLQNSVDKGDVTNSAKFQDPAAKLLLAMLDNGFTISSGALNSSHRCYSDSGNISDHKYGLAIDIGSAGSKPSLNEIYVWLYNNRAAFSINDLIFDPVPPGTKTVDNGQPGGNFGSDTLADHRDHIHVSVFGTRGPKPC